ncbi:hypothetical protein B0H14DRAFT_2558751 [Mycena olivaceomarginata]|nr:hypothetical protein B0H14DRAFT_2558751 [Mycena olivaceomarginata]
MHLEGDYGTALCAACANGRVEVVSILLQQGANIQINGPFGAALHVAVWRDDKKMVNLLLDTKGDGADCEYGKCSSVDPPCWRLTSAICLPIQQRGGCKCCYVDHPCQKLTSAVHVLIQQEGADQYFCIPIQQFLTSAIHILVQQWGVLLYQSTIPEADQCHLYPCPTVAWWRLTSAIPHPGPTGGSAELIPHWRLTCAIVSWSNSWLTGDARICGQQSLTSAICILTQQFVAVCVIVQQLDRLTSAICALGPIGGCKCYSVDPPCWRLTGSICILIYQFCHSCPHLTEGSAAAPMSIPCTGGLTGAICVLTQQREVGAATFDPPCQWLTGAICILIQKEDRLTGAIFASSNRGLTGAIHNLIQQWAGLVQFPSLPNRRLTDAIHILIDRREYDPLLAYCTQKTYKSFCCLSINRREHIPWTDLHKGTQESLNDLVQKASFDVQYPPLQKFPKPDNVRAPLK